ncbi:IclR family transcriptional regulator [Polymorphospora rubra]|uniref:IclR family transcriptional regulator n=1 Tax=Polymorphospora rubra TaxID=338584 RepID=A0A810N238_9ACTN|nr:IclR family transcriptional regulator [Polymorphospora rubra]BCJ67701.1 IclR family transcriptional regulator [Polymorphospora rubra]
MPTGATVGSTAERAAPAPDRGAVGQSRSVVAVERAMDVLLFFGRSGQADLGVTEIATALGLTKAVVHRILTALRSRDLIVLDPTTHRYALGHAAVALGRSYLARTDLRTAAGPELRGLSDLTGETATLSVRRGDTRLHVDQAVPDQEEWLELDVGVPYPLHAGGSSKAFLAFLDDVQISAYLCRRLTRLTDRTITDPVRLRAEIVSIRSLGYSTSYGECRTGAASMAAPVFGHDCRVAAVIGVSGPEARFRPDTLDATEALLAAAARISDQLGYRAA